MIKNNFIKANLFWKIFLWFWLSFVLIFILNLFILQLNNDSIRYQKTPAHLTQQIITSIGRIEKFLAKPKNKRKTEYPKFSNVYMVSIEGVDLLGKSIPDGLLSLDKYVTQSKHPMSIVTKDQIIYGGLTIDIGQQTHRVYINRIFSYLSGDYLKSFFQEFAYSILISAFLISFPFSFLLAWLVVAPIKRLQQVSRDISKDIKDRKNLQPLLRRSDEFYELATDFESMAEQIEQQLTARTRLISAVSHELRSPLTRMQIAIGIANHKLNKDGKNSELERVKLEAKRMNTMLTDLLDLSKIDNLYSQKNNEDIDMRQLLTILIGDAKFEAEQVGISIETNLQDDIYLQGNKVALLSCLENIIRNSIRYAKSSIKLSCYKSDQEGVIRISIFDDGDGVSEKDINNIFEAFYRPELDRSRESGGVGLGLSIAQKVVDAHSGRIWAENKQPAGFSIHIALPLK